MERLSERMNTASIIAQQFLESPKYLFRETDRNTIEAKAGVYAIFDQSTGETLYVGRTKNLRRRLCSDHLRGPKANARLKKYLAEDEKRKDIMNMDQAKQYLLNHCYFQYVCENNTRTRGQLEGLLSYLLDVTYIYEEH